MTKEINNDLRPFITVLGSLGFTQDYDSRAGGERTVQFSRVTGRRTTDNITAPADAPPC